MCQLLCGIRYAKTYYVLRVEHGPRWGLNARLGFLGSFMSCGTAGRARRVRVGLIAIGWFREVGEFHGELGFMMATRQSVTITEGNLQVYQARDLNSAVVTRLPKGMEIQIGTGEVFEGREWMEASLGTATIGYVLGPQLTQPYGDG